MFETIGETARWRMVYPILAGTEVEGVIEYDTLAGVLGLDAEADRHIVQQTVRRAGKELEVVDKRAIEVVKNVGYRVVKPVEHLRLASKQQRRARKALKRSESKVVNVDLSNESPEVRNAFALCAQAISVQSEVMNRLDLRQRKLSNALDAIHVKTTRTDSEVDELKERVARMEQQFGGNN